MSRLPVLAAALLIAGIGTLPAPVPALAQVESREGIALQNQILELRRDLEALRAAGAGRVAPPSGTMPPAAAGDVLARLVERVQALEEQVRALRGRVDELDNRTGQIRADLDKQRTDLEFRLDQLEGRGNQRPPQQGQQAQQRPPQGGTATQPAQPEPRPQGADGLFNAAQAAFRANQFAESERLFRDFARQYGNDRRAPEAYWAIGQSLLNRREWAQAALAFDESFRRFPRGAFAQESLLGLGNALAGLGDRTAACEAYGRLASQFATNLKPAIATALGPARQRANCR